MGQDESEQHNSFAARIQKIIGSFAKLWYNYHEKR